MTTYELPPEPPTGTRVTDKDGTEWTQAHKGYWFDADQNLIDWRALVFARGPLTDATPAEPEPWTPKAGEKVVVTETVGSFLPGDVLTVMKETDEDGDVKADRGDDWSYVPVSHLRPFDPDRDDTVPVPRKALDELREVLDRLRGYRGPQPLESDVVDYARALVAAVDEADER